VDGKDYSFTGNIGDNAAGGMEMGGGGARTEFRSTAWQSRTSATRRVRR
jgi:hypothetical protein